MVFLVVRAKCEHSISEAFRFLNSEFTRNNEKKATLEDIYWGVSTILCLLRESCWEFPEPEYIPFLYLCVGFFFLFLLKTILFIWSFVLFFILSYHRQCGTTWLVVELVYRFSSFATHEFIKVTELWKPWFWAMLRY